MKVSRVYNFSAGPAVLPEEVLKEAAAEMLDYKGCGMSVMEMSHRSQVFDDIIKEAEQDLRDLMHIPDNYKVLFLQGGASQQFAMIPMNLMKNKVADYIVTGQWAKKAYQEAQKYGKVNKIATSEDKTFSYIPDCSDLPVSPDADYVYICENNTIYGTKFKTLPNTKGKTLVADVSSCFLSEPVDVTKYGIIYGGVQKNIGPAGMVISIIREDLITDEVLEGTPTMLKFKTHADAGSLYNTPNCYCIYMCGKVFKWLKKMGGLEVMKERNEKKAKLLYDYLDSSKLFKGTVEKDSRSLMNVPFVTGDKDLDAKFVKEAKAVGLENLKGHRTVGGMRASIYNAMPYEGVEALVAFMKKFEEEICKMKYTCLNPIASVGLDQFTEGYEKTEKMEDADAVLVRSAAMHDLELPDGLYAVARAGAGVNNIPLDKCAEKGIVVFNTPGANANGVKELVIAGMLLASRDIIGGVEWAKSEAGSEDIAKKAEKEKKKFAGCELMGKKLGIIGLGAIGIQVANVAECLGMDVYGYDPYISVDAAWKLSKGVKHIKDVDDIYRTCDYITIHVPLLDSTRKMINQDAIDLMKENVVILNFARDMLVDEEAIVKALKEGKVKKYVCDFPNTTTAGVKNAIIIPHLGASTAESEDNCAKMAVQELMEYLEKGNIINSVNYPNCSLGECTHANRIAINHRNVKNMLGQFTDIFATSDINIANMVNKSKGDYAYSLFDLDSVASKEVLDKICAVEGVLRVRVIK